jgi:hypothetical protein
MDIERLNKKIDMELGEIITEIADTWNQIPDNERGRLLQKFYLEFGQARKVIQDFVNDGGESKQLAEKTFTDLPKTIQTYVKLAFNSAQGTFDRQNICEQLKKHRLPLNF